MMMMREKNEKNEKKRREIQKAINRRIEKVLTRSNFRQ
jgi:hypothetical protein